MRLLLAAASASAPAGTSGEATGTSMVLSVDLTLGSAGSRASTMAVPATMSPSRCRRSPVRSITTSPTT